MFDELCATGRTTSWPGSTASPTPGKPPPRCSCAPATRPRSTPTRRTAGSSPAPSTTTSTRIADDWLGRRRSGQDRRDHRLDQRARRRAQRRRSNAPGSPPATSTADRGARSASGEHAHVGDVVVTRRNDRHLLTSAVEPVRNRDPGPSPPSTPTAASPCPTSADTAAVTLPADYVREHVRLGYAATEHGHQGDTVDVAIALVTARHQPPRPVRRRDPRARPEPPPRRHRHHRPRPKPATSSSTSSPTTAPTPPPSPNAATSPRPDGPEPVREPEQVVPGWLADYRDRLEQRRDDLTAGLTERAHRRTRPPPSSPTCSRRSPPPGRHGSPTPTASTRSSTSWPRCCARRCGKPTTTPARAGFGQRHGAARRVKIATWHVDDAQDRIAAIRADGAHIRERLDAVEVDARRLAQLASTNTGHYGIDQLDRDQLHALDRTAEAIDTWTTWASGRPVPTAELVDAVSLLHDVALHVPPLPTRSAEIDRTHWFELLEPVTAVLEQRGLLDARPRRSRSRTRRSRPEHRPLSVSAASHSCRSRRVSEA